MNAIIREAQLICGDENHDVALEVTVKHERGQQKFWVKIEDTGLFLSEICGRSEQQYIIGTPVCVYPGDDGAYIEMVQNFLEPEKCLKTRANPMRR